MCMNIEITSVISEICIVSEPTTPDGLEASGQQHRHHITVGKKAHEKNFCNYVMSVT